MRSCSDPLTVPMNVYVGWLHQIKLNPAMFLQEYNTQDTQHVHLIKSSVIKPRVHISHMRTPDGTKIERTQALCTHARTVV